MTIYGYARVSTDGQTLDAQLAALRAAGAERVFAEKISGAVTDRKALGKALAALGSGDVLLVTRLDRLARSTRDLLNVLAAIAEGATDPVPMALRNPVTGLMSAEGFGKGYAYAHDHDDAVTSLECLPDRLRGKRFYRPTQRGLEGELSERIEAWLAARSRSDLR